MIPSIPSVYPEYVADQVLTAHDLNESFRYLDEQGRMTRTNLVGIGIVCGLTIETSSAPVSITITKGVGVTSAGYLVTVPTKTYTRFKPYDPTKDKVYDRFATGTPPVKKFDLWELVEAAVDPNAADLATMDLSDKIVLIFVELLQVGNKNCDPNSCDDKGRHYEVTFRPLLVAKENAETLITPGGSGGNDTHTTLLLPDIRMRRFDVPATPLIDSGDLFAAYLRILDKPFVEGVADSLKNAYNKLLPILNNGTADPAITALFDSIKTTYKFLFDGTITPAQLVVLQYYYDFFSDLLAAYRELREKGRTSVCECAPDESLFPRHLLLGEAVGFDERTSKFRHRFMASPALCCCRGDADVIRILFVRLVLMIRKFDIPNFISANDGEIRKNPIRITPSLLSKDDLSEKAIPYYYQVNSVVDPGEKPLYLSWSAERAANGTAHQILSYHANRYNSTDEFVLRPLRYDLEPYNFLRIEGHIGLDYEVVLAALTHARQSSRLPFEVVAINADLKSIFHIILALQGLDKGGFAEALALVQKHACCFADIFLLLGDIITRMRCCLLDQLKFYLALPANEANLATMKATRFKTGLMAKMEPDFDIATDTIGHSYQVKIEANEIDQYCARIFSKILTDDARPGAAAIIMPNRIDRFADVLPDHIQDVDPVAFEARYKDLVDTAAQLRKLFASPKLAAGLEGINRDLLVSRLQVSCITCLFRELQTVMREFLLRLLRFMLRQKLGYYAVINPGIQHKAGVTMGGTFVIVYHDHTDIDLRGELSAKLLAALTGKQALLSSFLVGEELKYLAEMLRVKQQGPDALAEPVSALRKGMVIADFYLPYICTSDCAPVAYMLPKPPLTDPLTASLGAPECDANNKEYIVAVSISGGKPPYTVNGSGPDPATGQYIVKFTSGQGGPVTVADSEGTKVELVQQQHLCCPYPCDGASERCFFVLWFQRPQSDDDVVSLREVAGKLFLTDAGGTRKQVATDAFNKINDANVNASSYNGLFKIFVEALNNAIPPEYTSANVPMFGYDPEKQLLIIERFICQRVEIEMQLLMVSNRQDVTTKLEVRYNDKGVTIITVDGQSLEVAKFGCVLMNKCSNTPGVAAGMTLAAPELGATRSGENATFATKPATPKPIFWYFYDGKIKYSNKPKPVVPLVGEPANTMVYVVVADKDGNFAIVQKKVKVS